MRLFEPRVLALESVSVQQGSLRFVRKSLMFTDGSAKFSGQLLAVASWAVMQIDDGRPFFLVVQIFNSGGWWDEFARKYALLGPLQHESERRLERVLVFNCAGVRQTLPEVGGGAPNPIKL